jgi:hypothetical protein
MSLRYRMSDAAVTEILRVAKLQKKAKFNQHSLSGPVTMLV